MRPLRLPSISSYSFMLILLSLASQYAVLSQNTPNKYIPLSVHRTFNNDSYIGYSPNQQLIVQIQNNKPFITLYNGKTFDRMDFFNTVHEQIPSCFAFAPDSSFLILGTQGGYLLSYKIDINKIVQLPGFIKQNQNQQDILSISVSSNLQIAAGGEGKYITLYTLDEDMGFNLVKTILFGIRFTSLAFTPDGSSLLAGGGGYFNQGKFLQIATADPFTPIVINYKPTYTVAAFSTYYVQAIDEAIKIYKSADNTVAGSIQYDADIISISQNGEFMIARSIYGGFLALNITVLKTPTVLLDRNITSETNFAVSSDGLSLLITTNDGVVQYGLCKAAQFFITQTNQCKDCDKLCLNCSGSASSQTCYRCVFGAVLSGTSCKNCSIVIKACISCHNETYCNQCDQTKYFTDNDGKCVCLNTFYLDLQSYTCRSCQTAMKGCKECDSENNCTRCNEAERFYPAPENKGCQCLAEQNRILNPDNTKCVCKNFYFQNTSNTCQLCDEYQKCRVCTDSNNCTICNQVNHWRVTQKNTCVCMPGYYDNSSNQCIYCEVLGCDQCSGINTCESCNQADGFLPNPKIVNQSVFCLCQQGRYNEADKCPLCSSAISGCLICDSANSCTKCDAQNHFQLQNATCECSAGYFLQLKICNLCKTGISNCLICDSRRFCSQCAESFILSNDKKFCNCAQNYVVQNGKCVQQGNLLIILIIAGCGVLGIVIGVVIYLRFCRKKRTYAEQNFQNEANKYQSVQIRASSKQSSLLDGNQENSFDKGEKFAQKTNQKLPKQRVKIKIYE